LRTLEAQQTASYAEDALRLAPQRLYASR